MSAHACAMMVSMLVLQFLSADQTVQADCAARNWDGDAQHAAIFLGRRLRHAEEDLVRSLDVRIISGRYVRYANRIYGGTPRKRVAEGECTIYVFPNGDGRDAFCLCSGAAPARFERAIAADSPV
jgi:hypothetical protein